MLEDDKFGQNVQHAKVFQTKLYYSNLSKIEWDNCRDLVINRYKTMKNTMTF